MELVLVAHGGRAALKVADVGVVVGDDERPLELPRVAGVDAEIGTEFHGAPHALGDIYERTVGEDGAVECGIEVVAVGNDGAQVLPHQVGVLLHRLADGAEDDALLGQFLLEGGLHRHGVHDGIDGRPAQGQTLLQGYAKLVEHLLQLRVHLLVGRLLGQRVGVVGDALVVHLRHMDVPPAGLLHRLPVVEGLQPEVEEPLGLALLLGDESHDILVETLVDDFRRHVGGEAELVFLLGHLPDELVLLLAVFLLVGGGVVGLVCVAPGHLVVQMSGGCSILVHDVRVSAPPRFP